jgi:hypothetical protein
MRLQPESNIAMATDQLFFVASASGAAGPFLAYSSVIGDP